jgi:hypothetical protein
MPAYETADAEAFVVDLLKALVDPAKRTSLENSEGLETKVPGYRPEFYPFTENAFHKFCRYFGEQPKIGKPAEIIPKLDFLAAEAFMQSKRVLDEDFLVQQGINA